MHIDFYPYCLVSQFNVNISLWFLSLSLTLSPLSLKVQIASNVAQLEELQQTLQQYALTAPLLSRLHSGLLCLVHCTDGTWYRSVLTDTVNLRQDEDNLIEVGVVSGCGYM